MKLREVTEAQTQKYLYDISSVTKNYDGMIKKIDNLLLQYGDIHYRMTKDIVSVNHARDKKEELKIEMKNINLLALDKIVASLKDLKKKYIADITPESSTVTDPLEVSLIEKELSVMQDKELIDYYKENYLDRNIVRLVEVEYKKRNGYKDGKIIIPLPKYGAVDGITSRIDKEVNQVIGLRQVVSSMCCFQESREEGTTKPVMIPWNTILNQVENRNRLSVVKVTIGDLYKQNISK